ncbi:MAG: hypothetical protein ACE5IP_08790 [Terriglobia bacterium]
MSDFHTVLGLAAVDKEFAAALCRDPLNTLKEHGFFLTVDEFKAVREQVCGNPKVTEALVTIADAMCPHPPCGFESFLSQRYGQK